MIAFFAVAVGMWGGERIKGRQLNPAFVTPLLVLHLGSNLLLYNSVRGHTCIKRSRLG